MPHRKQTDKALKSVPAQVAHLRISRWSSSLSWSRKSSSKASRLRAMPCQIRSCGSCIARNACDIQQLVLDAPVLDHHSLRHSTEQACQRRYTGSKCYNPPHENSGGSRPLGLDYSGQFEAVHDGQKAPERCPGCTRYADILQ